MWTASSLASLWLFSASLAFLRPASSLRASVSARGVSVSVSGSICLQLSIPTAGLTGGSALGLLLACLWLILAGLCFLADGYFSSRVLCRGLVPATCQRCSGPLCFVCVASVCVFLSLRFLSIFVSLCPFCVSVFLSATVGGFCLSGRASCCRFVWLWIQGNSFGVHSTSM